MVNAVIVLDESGAKGKSNKKENYPGEFGIMAGFICKPEALIKLREITDVILSNNNNLKKEAKVHITDLSKEEQNHYRKIAIDFLKMNNVVWSYSAIYVNGFHRFNKNNEKPVLLHAQLFLGLILKLSAFLKVRYPNEIINLTIITDIVQAKTIKMFLSSLEPCVNLMKNGCHTTYSTCFNPSTKKIENITVKVNMDEVSFNNIAIPEFNIEIKTEDTPVTFLADILVNTTYRHLMDKQKKANDFNIRLEHKNILRGHPLYDSVYGASDDKTLSISDEFFFRERD